MVSTEPKSELNSILRSNELVLKFDRPGYGTETAPGRNSSGYDLSLMQARIGAVRSM